MWSDEYILIKEEETEQSTHSDKERKSLQASVIW